MPINNHIKSINLQLLTSLVNQHLIVHHMLQNLFLLIENSTRDMKKHQLITSEHQLNLSSSAITKNHQYINHWLDYFKVNHKDRQEITNMLKSRIEQTALTCVVIDTQYKKNPLKKEKLTEIKHDVNILNHHIINFEMTNILDNPWIKGYLTFSLELEHVVINILKAQGSKKGRHLMNLMD